MPHPGHGNPDSILNGQNDCFLAKDSPPLISKTTYGKASDKSAPTIT